jgi:hypothetical protein
MSRHPVSKKKPTRRRRPEPDPRAALEVHQLDGGIKATLYPGMVEFSLDRAAVRPSGARPQRKRPKKGVRHE